MFYKSKGLSILETNINVELNNIHIWLCANKLSLNIEKSNFVIFHPPQKRLQSHNFSLAINNKQLKREFCVRYLGILIDSNLNWKDQVEGIVKKIRRSIGILSKLLYYVDLDIIFIKLILCPFSINTQVIIQNRALSLARYLGLSADNHLDGQNGCQ